MRCKPIGRVRASHLRAPLAAAGIGLLLAGAMTGAGCGPRATREAAWDPDSIADAYSRPSAALVWPGLSRSFLVDSAGSLMNGLWSARVDLSALTQSRSSENTSNFGAEVAENTIPNLESTLQGAKR